MALENTFKNVGFTYKILRYNKKCLTKIDTKWNGIFRGKKKPCEKKKKNCAKMALENAFNPIPRWGEEETCPPPHLFFLNFILETNYKPYRIMLICTI